LRANEGIIEEEGSNRDTTTSKLKLLPNYELTNAALNYGRQSKNIDLMSEKT
jgi:hypothetical protein